MTGKRKQAEAFCLEYIEKLLPGSENAQYYKTLFAGMSDKQFDDFIAAIKGKRAHLAIVAPNLSEHKLSVERNLALAKELGHNFFQRIWMNEGNGQDPYLTPISYPVVKLPFRRQVQVLEKKRSIPENNKSIDYLTGQPTGPSKGSKISYPETQIMSTLNLTESLTELIKVRGGDIEAFNAMNDQISKTGSASLETITSAGTTVRSTRTLSTILTAMHLSNTLLAQ